MARLWLHQVLPYAGMSEEELSYCIVHLGFPMPRSSADAATWAAWEVDRWLQAEREGTVRAA